MAARGGATEFNLRPYDSDTKSNPLVNVQPEPGKALVFIHNVLHRGASVSEGRKYVLRTDVMCRWVAE